MPSPRQANDCLAAKTVNLGQMTIELNPLLHAPIDVKDHRY